MSNLTTQGDAPPRNTIDDGLSSSTLSNGNGSMLQGNRHYISYKYPDQNWLAMLPREVQTSLCLLTPYRGNQRCLPRFSPWIAPIEVNGLKHFNVLRTESHQSTCPPPPSPRIGKELFTDAIWRVVQATGNTHLGILSTAVQQENGMQIRFHIRRTTTLIDGTIESVEYHYTLQTFRTIIAQFADATLENGTRDPAAKLWYVNLVDLILQTTDRAYLEVIETSCALLENFPDAEFYRAGPNYRFLDEGVVDLVLEYIGIDLIEEEDGTGPDRICAICTELMRVDQKSTHAAVKLSCGHCFGVECIRRWLQYPVNGSTSCPMCRKRIYLPSYADYHPELVPLNLPWDSLEFRLQIIDEIYTSGNFPRQVKITDPAKFLLALQYLIGVQLHAPPVSLPPRYNPATYPETKSMMTALCDYMDETKDPDNFNDLLCTLCNHIAERIGADNGISWDRHNWIISSINNEWLFWAGKTIKRALWMTMIWNMNDWPPTDAYHCLEIKRVVNLRYPCLQQKMEELNPTFARGIGSLRQGCGAFALE